MTPGGRKNTQRAIVVVGNKNGAAGKILHLDYLPAFITARSFLNLK